MTANVKAESTCTSSTSNYTSTTGFLQELRTMHSLHQGEARSGKQIYEYRCISCHGKNTQGAPVPGDRREWSIRIEKGMEVLLDHTINGYKDYMPAKGGCYNCRDDELKAAIEYMSDKNREFTILINQ